LKLTDIRRPAFFGRAPYFEEIAKGEQNTYTIEFTVPRDTLERLQLKMTAPVKLRGWFIQGNGVPDAKGKKRHALVIFICGLSGQWFTISHPDVPSYRYNVQTKQYESLSPPDSFFLGEKTMRRYLYGFYQAGFDVLAVDKRGHGVSGGVNALNSVEMSEDIFRMLDQFESGEGLTVLAPSGQLLQGKQTAGLLLRGMSAKQVPVIIGGQSQGTIVTSEAMQKNFVGFTAFNEPGQKFSPAKKYNIKAALLLSGLPAGLGYVNVDPMLVYREAAYRVEKNTGMVSTSEILANIDKWPAVFMGHGLWDKYQSPEGAYDAYHRAEGLKELIYVKAMHTTAFW
jgi:pimeloyl-ACP methyl ester carboxylesterase